MLFATLPRISQKIQKEFSATHLRRGRRGGQSNKESSDQQDWESHSNEMAHFILRRGWRQTIKMSGAKAQHSRLLNRFAGFVQVARTSTCANPVLESLASVRARS